jgi:hypothetical protein
LNPSKNRSKISNQPSTSFTGEKTMKKQNQNLSPAERNAIQMADAVFGALSKPPMSPVTSMPPDPDEKNMERAEWAHRAILAFESATGTDREDALADLLGDLMHWSNVYGQDFDRELDRARRHYASETTTEPGWNYGPVALQKVGRA